MHWTVVTQAPESKADMREIAVRHEAKEAGDREIERLRAAEEARERVETETATAIAELVAANKILAAEARKPAPPAIGSCWLDALAAAGSERPKVGVRVAWEEEGADEMALQRVAMRAVRCTKRYDSS